MERKRNVDVEKLSGEQVDRISEKLSEKLSEIINKAVNEANEILSIYDLETQMQFLTPYKKGQKPQKD